MTKFEVESSKTHKKQQFSPFFGSLKDSFCTPFLSLEPIDGNQIKWEWNFPLAKLEVESSKTHKKQQFSPFCGSLKDSFYAPFLSTDSNDDNYSSLGIP